MRKARRIGCPNIQTVVGSGFVSQLALTFATPVNNDETLLAVVINADGCQDTLARVLTVAGSVQIHVQTVQAQRAVVAIGAATQRQNRFFAVQADEGLFPRNERAHAWLRMEASV